MPKKLSKSKKRRARDEVMLLHLTKPFKTGAHKSKKDYNRQKNKEQLRKELWSKE